MAVNGSETTPCRVVMVVRLFHPWIGGSELQALTLAQGLAERGVDVRIVTGWWFRGTSRRETIGGIRVFRNHTLWEFFGVKGLRRLGGYLYMVSLGWHLWRTRNTYDVLHAHGMNYHSAVAVRAGHWIGRPCVTKLANSGIASDVEKMRQDRQLWGARHLLGSALRSDRFVALSPAIVEELRSVDIPDSRISSIPNGVSLDGLTPRSSYAIDGPARIVFIGRLHGQKGLDTLIDAADQVERMRPDRIRVDLVGEGPRRRDLEARVRDLGLSTTVRFIGEREDVNEVLQEADMFVLPSRAEGLSNALLEAMAHGLPVLVSNVPGNSAVIDHDTNGLRFTVDDPNSLADNIVRLLDDEDLRARIGRGAIRTVESGYALSRVVEAYLALYAEMITETDGSADEALKGPATTADL